MAVIRWYDRPSALGPFRELEKLQNEMNRLFSSYFGPERARPVGVFPAVNVSEDEKALYVRAELPGMKPDDVDISVEGDTLTLKGERKSDEPGEGISYHRRERDSGRFRRILNLPVRIDTDAVEASFKNGVLKIVLPKAKEALPKQIQVKTES